jgi:thiol-disulfide isomerase/thioredoxin
MDGTWSIGPLMIAADRALAVAAMWIFLAIGMLIARRTKAPAERAAGVALLAGVVAARLGFVAQHFSAFRAEPWSIIAIWQGGFAPTIGVAGAATAVLVVLGRQRATALLLGALVVLSLGHAGLTAAFAPEPRPLPRGLTVYNLGGAPVAIDTMRGKPFVLNLWATWCGPCRREMPMIIDVARQSNIPVLLINQREDRAAVRRFLTSEGLGGDAIALDPGGHVAVATMAGGYPTTLFVDSAGGIVHRHTGEISRASLMAAINDLEGSTP